MTQHLIASFVFNNLFSGSDGDDTQQWERWVRMVGEKKKLMKTIRDVKGCGFWWKRLSSSSPSRKRKRKRKTRSAPSVPASTTVLPPQAVRCRVESKQGRLPHDRRASTSRFPTTHRNVEIESPGDDDFFLQIALQMTWKKLGCLLRGDERRDSWAGNDDGKQDRGRLRRRSPSCPFLTIFSPPMSALSAGTFTLHSKPPPTGALYLQFSAFSFSFSPIRHCRFHVSSPSPGHSRLLQGIFTCQRGFRKTKRKPFAVKKEAAKEK